MRYVGEPALESESGEPDLLPGEFGTIVDLYEPAGVLVVAWDNLVTLDMGGTTEIEKTGDG